MRDMSAKVCDDERMKLKGFRPLDRGEMSILAALVLISILGATGLFLQTVGPGPIGQTASVGGVVAQAAPEGSNPYGGLSNTGLQSTGNVSQPATSPQKQDEACKNQIANAIKNGGTSKSEKPQTFTKDTIEQNVCVGAVYDPSKVKSGDQNPKQNPANYKCDVGEHVKISMKSGDGKMEAEADSSMPKGKCKVEFCDTEGKNCSKAVEVDGGKSLSQWAQDPNVLGALNADQKQAIQSFGSLPSQDQLQSAYTNLDKGGTAVDDGLKTCAQQGVSAANCTVAIDQQVANANGIKCTEGTDYQTCFANGQQALQQLDQKQTELNQQLKQLQGSSQALGGTWQGPCPAGQVNNGNSCVPAQGSIPAGGQGSTFGGSANSFLKGLAQGFGQAMMPHPAAPPPAQSMPAQPCSTDPNIYAQQQQQYQQQMQQYNYQMQQYNYQLQVNAYNAQQTGGLLAPAPQMPQQPSACTPSTQQQCQIQPTQPPASSCSGGGWTPQYSGNCVVGWQCSNLGASISCQPQTADIGMQVAISYSCAQGRASGSGFDVNDPTAGTSAVTIDAPPDGTNTANFAVTCSYRGITSGAQCSVQIVQPKITLVANPRDIASGGTSLLGWITTGMQSCVISSPDDATFTSQNSSNTSVNGTAETLPATSTKQYVLSCQTYAGGTKSASTTVVVQ